MGSLLLFSVGGCIAEQVITYYSDFFRDCPNTTDKLE